LLHNAWFIEYFTPYEGHMHGVKEYLAFVRTKFQQADLLVTHRYGKTLFLDGKIQSALGDEFIYHEALVHPPLITHPQPREVLIVGGGEGATLREVLRHNTVTSAVMVDIDEELVRYCQQHLAEWSRGAFTDPRTHLVFADARGYLETSTRRFDAIIIDLPEPLPEGPAWRLYTRQFYRSVYDHLTEQGTIALQAGTTHAGDTELLVSIAKTLRAVFPVVRPYQASIPSFDLPWGFVLASRSQDPGAFSVAEVDRRLHARGLDDLEYYDGITHQGDFALPKYLRKDLDSIGAVIDDDKPFFLNV
jgi:spermidine synthase